MFAYCMIVGAQRAPKRHRRTVHESNQFLWTKSTFSLCASEWSRWSKDVWRKFLREDESTIMITHWTAAPSLSHPTKARLKLPPLIYNIIMNA